MNLPPKLLPNNDKERLRQYLMYSPLYLIWRGDIAKVVSCYALVGALPVSLDMMIARISDIKLATKPGNGLNLSDWVGDRGKVTLDLQKSLSVLIYGSPNRIRMVKAL